MVLFANLRTLGLGLISATGYLSSNVLAHRVGVNLARGGVEPVAIATGLVPRVKGITDPITAATATGDPTPTASLCPVFSCAQCPSGSHQTFTTRAGSPCSSCACVPGPRPTPSFSLCPIYSCAQCPTGSHQTFTTSAGSHCASCACVAGPRPTPSISTACPVATCLQCKSGSTLTFTKKPGATCSSCACAPITTGPSIPSPPIASDCPTYSCAQCQTGSYQTFTTAVGSHCASCACLPGPRPVVPPIASQCPTYSCGGPDGTQILTSSGTQCATYACITAPITSSTPTGAGPSALVASASDGPNSSAVTVRTYTGMTAGVLALLGLFTLAAHQAL